MKTYPLILASTSKYRAQLLSQLGWPFSSQDPGVDEAPLKSQGLHPRELALKLSLLKAQAVAEKNPESVVIGSDQVCALGETLLSKPHTIQKAIEQLHLLSGKSHQLFTAVTVISPKNTHSFVNVTTLHMRSFSEAAQRSYVEADLPLDCAGSYKLESRGIKLFSRIEMSDHTAIIGLPLIELSDVLLREGFAL